MNHAQLEAPSWLGRLPRRVGEPAGGNLSSDEYKTGVTSQWPLIVRHSFHERQSHALIQPAPDSNYLG
jgi:hypothetical protein